MAVLLGLVEEIADAACADTNEHLNEIRAADGEERTPASPATARASRVLPVPGGPKSNTPFGILAPMDLNFCGFLRKSTTSSSSSLTSSAPATSAKVTRFWLSTVTRALLLPNWFILPPPPWVELIKKKNRPTNKSTGRSELSRLISADGSGVFACVTSTPASASRSARLSSFFEIGILNVSPSIVVPSMVW